MTSTLTLDEGTELTLDGPVTIRVGTPGGGAVREVQVGGDGETVVTVGQVLASNGVTLGADQSVSLNGGVVEPDHEIDLTALEPDAVPVLVVAPRVNNG